MSSFKKNIEIYFIFRYSAIMTTGKRYTVTIKDTGEHYECRPDETLLKAMERLGKKGIPVGCRGGGCGVCKVKILNGDIECRRMSRAHVTEQEQTAGYLLACRAFAASDIELTVIGKMQKAFAKNRDDRG